MLIWKCYIKSYAIDGPTLRVDFMKSLRPPSLFINHIKTTKASNQCVTSGWVCCVCLCVRYWSPRQCVCLSGPSILCSVRAMMKCAFISFRSSSYAWGSQAVTGSIYFPSPTRDCRTVVQLARSASGNNCDLKWTFLELKLSAHSYLMDPGEAGASLHF